MMPDAVLPAITSPQGTALASTPPQLITFPNLRTLDGKSATGRGEGNIRLDASLQKLALEEV